VAKIGLRHFTVSISGQPGFRLNRAIAASLKINTLSTDLTSDDQTVDSDPEFLSGELSLSPDDFTDWQQALMLGHTYSEADGLSCNVDDQSPECGAGFISVQKVRGKVTYRPVWFPRIVFREPDEDYKTRAKDVEFGYFTLSGVIMLTTAGKWQDKHTFDTEAAALAWLNNKAGLEE